jgi:hypothetical protein
VLLGVVAIVVLIAVCILKVLHFGAGFGLLLLLSGMALVVPFFPLVALCDTYERASLSFFL